MIATPPWAAAPLFRNWFTAPRVEMGIWNTKSINFNSRHQHFQTYVKYIVKEIWVGLELFRCGVCYRRSSASVSSRFCLGFHNGPFFIRLIAFILVPRIHPHLHRVITGKDFIRVWDCFIPPLFYTSAWLRHMCFKCFSSNSNYSSSSSNTSGAYRCCCT